MKQTWKRLLSAALAMLLVFSVSGAALAVGFGDDYSDGSFGAVTVETGISVKFVSDDDYVLDAQPGTTTLSDGSVRVNMDKGLMPDSLVPDVTGADEYYKITGWAVKNDKGELVEIDIEKYNFKDNTEVYALYEDVWPVYADMNQNRTDWYYTYVRDLSIDGVVDGFPGYIFKPKGNVTWGQALKLVMLATDYSEQAPTGSHWASGYLTTAKADGLVPAAKDVDLNASITRLEIADLAYEAMELAKADIDTPFADTEAESVLALYVAKIVEGSTNASGERMYYPNNYITRAELSTIIYRINHYEG